MPSHDFLKHTEGEIRKTIEINFTAHFWMFQAFLPTMIEHNRGHVVALSSMAGIMGFQNLVPYCGTKFAVRGLMEAMSEELRCKTKGQSQVRNLSGCSILTSTFTALKAKIFNLSTDSRRIL